MILLRHTRTEAPAGVCYGRTDLPLAADFETDAQRVMRELPPVSNVVASPLGRCRRLAERIAATRDLPLCEDPRLTEMDFGAWEGRAWDAVERGALDAWAADFHGARVHGGESVAMLAARVASALAAAEPRRPPTLWVTHAGVARAVAALAGRFDGWNTRLDFGDWLDFSAS